MASNPDWQDPNRRVSDSTVHKRVFDFDNDAYRVHVVEPVPLEAGDIQIGAVELKDGDTDTRVDVEEVGNNNAVLVENARQFQKTSINNFGSALISPATTLELVSFTVPSSTSFEFIGGIVGGDEYGEFIFEVGGTTIALARNSGSNRTIMMRFLESQSVGAGTTVKIKATNIGHRTKQFEATLSGYTLPV